MLLDEINRIQREIDLLPQGYISHKTINGKVYHYLQQRRGGKTVGQYIPEGQYEHVVAGIARRKELERELENLRNRSYYDIPAQGAPLDWPMDVRIGRRLQQFIAPAAGLERRECYNAVADYLYSDAEAKVCALYGLRRTGKTTLICQVIHDMTADDLARTAYIKAEKGQNMPMVKKCLNALYKMGYKYVFLDEITLLSDFMNRAAPLSDIYAQEGMKIVLSGTDSLGFWFASRHNLYERVYLVHTTWIPFREHSRLLKTDDIDDYIEHGGTLYGSTAVDKSEDKESGVSPFTDVDKTEEYIESSIAENIQHSLEFFKHGDCMDPFIELYRNNELTNAINRVVEDMNHKFVVEVFNKEFVSSDLSSAQDMMDSPNRKGYRTDLIDNIDREAVTERLMERLKIKNQTDCNVEIDEDLVSEIKDYLSYMEVIASIPFKKRRKTSEERILITQPGLRYCQVNALIGSLKEDDVYIGSEDVDKEAVCDLIRNDVKGRMLEEIVQFETIQSLGKDYDVVKFKCKDEEFDMVVHSKKDNTCQVYEIKHSTEYAPSQSKYLRNEDFCAAAEEFYGPVTGRFVLYRGKDFTDENGIRHLNVSDWLSNLPGSAVIS